MPTGSPGKKRRPLSEETKKRISLRKKGCKGRKISIEQKKKISLSNKGRKHSQETKNKLREWAIKRQSNPKTRAWENKKTNGWIPKTKEYERIRSSIQLRLWRESVYSRDNWTCQQCGYRGGMLNAHHIKSFSKHPELRFAIDNGITLCAKCHGSKHRKIKLMEV